MALRSLTSTFWPLAHAGGDRGLTTLGPMFRPSVLDTAANYVTLQ